MIPPDNSNGDSLAETQFTGPKPLVHGRHSGDCTPPAAEGDNVIDFASGDRVAGEALVLMANTKSHRPCVRLASCDVVHGPAIDGGCYPPNQTLGKDFRRFLPLFGTLPWKTSSVLSDTLSIAARCGPAVSQLGEREDVDHWPDSWRLIQRLERSDASDDTSLAPQIRSTLDRNSFSV